MPFRDSASQSYMKSVARRGPPTEAKTPAEESGGPTQREPEVEPEEDEAVEGELIEEEAPAHAEEWVPELPAPAAPQPALEQYKRK